MYHVLIHHASKLFHSTARSREPKKPLSRAREMRARTLVAFRCSRIYLDSDPTRDRALLGLSQARDVPC